jgi:hypothetical protein
MARCNRSTRVDRYADGLPNDHTYVAHRDASGALWSGTKAGAAPLSLPAAAAPSAVYVSRVAVAGTIRGPKISAAYLVRLNHEMARELMWREYPHRSSHIHVGASFAAQEFTATSRFFLASRPMSCSGGPDVPEMRCAVLTSSCAQL